jgi:hypothetical protein
MSKSSFRRTPIAGIRPEGGFAYIARIHNSRINSYLGPSPRAVLEDGLPLAGPANALHEEIRRNGRGLFSFWQGHVYFSTSDNTDPRSNGRRYEIEYLGLMSSIISMLRRKVVGIARMGQSAIDRKKDRPVNLQARIATSGAISKDLEYATGIGMNYLKLVSDKGFEVAGKVILEIGPGINFGSVLLLGCLGAHVMVADRFLTPWDDTYHTPFYGLLREWILKNMPWANPKPLDIILSRHKYCSEAIRCFATPLERLKGIKNESVDIIFSNAVLEHLADPALSFAQMRRVSVYGGRGYHQVDFRDHLDFSKPLEFLLMDDHSFAKDFQNRHGERGNRFRPSQYLDLFQKAGFSVEFQASFYADDKYIQELQMRLRGMGPKAPNYGFDDLKQLSGLYSVRRQMP